MDIGRLKKVGPARDQRDPLRGIVKHDGKMVGRAHVAPGQDHITDRGDKLIRGEGDRAGFSIQAMAVFGEVKRAIAQRGQSFTHIKPQRAGGFCVARVTAGAGVDQAVGAIDGLCALLRGTGGGGDVATVASASIDEAARPEVIKGTAVGRHPVGLAHHGVRPVNTKPCEVFVDLRLPLGSRAGLVDSFDTQQELSPRCFGQIMGQERRIGVAKVQRTGRGWGKSGGKCQFFSIR